jgi:hypothetical protein
MSLLIKILLVTAMTVLFLISANVILDNPRQSKSKQMGILKLVPPTLQANGGADTVLYWGIGQFGKSFRINAQNLNKNQRHIYILTM